MPAAQPSRRFGSVVQKDRGIGYNRRVGAGFQQAPRFEYRKNLTGPAQMEPGQVDISGPVQAAMEANQRQQRAESMNQQRRYGGNLYGRSNSPTRFSRQTRVGNMMVVQGSSQRRGGGQVMINLGSAAPSGYRRDHGVQAPGASSNYSNGRITTKWGHVPAYG